MKMYQYLVQWLYYNHPEVFQEWAQYVGDEKND
jgi:hypothetical protein